MRILFSLFALIMYTRSCNSSKKAAENTNTETTNSNTSNKMRLLLSGSYIITQIENTDNISNKLTINFDDKLNKVTGFTGCNRFFGAYTINNSALSFGNMATSKKFCPEEINAVERQLLNAISRVNSFTVQDNNLVLLENDTVLIKGIESVSTTKNDVVKNNYRTAIIYQISSRGKFENTYVSEAEILVSTDRSLNVRRQYNCKKADWNELNELIEAVDLETIHNLNAPTDKRLSDGAAHATLAIQISDVEYMSPTFDHGFPPKEIEALVNKVLTIKENAVKH